MEFILVYIREAHPGSIVSIPTDTGGKTLKIIAQTETMTERLRNLHEFLSLAGLTMPAVIDDEANSTKQAYSGWPDRLYAIGVDGKIAFKSAPGPVGFKVPDLAGWLRENVK